MGAFFVYFHHYGENIIFTINWSFAIILTYDFEVAEEKPHYKNYA